MKNLIFLILFGVLLTSSTRAQSSWYPTYGGEMLFSFADVSQNGNDLNTLLRWAPVLNIYTYANKDLSEHVGIYGGLSVLNVGYIAEGYLDPENQVTYKKKFRTYNLAVPVGLKIGNLSKFFFFGGYSVEFPFVYKEKTFDSGDRIDKINGWFSKRQESVQHGFHIGAQLPEGLTVNFKYYLSEFHNQDFTEGTGVKPYAGLDAHIFYFSLSYRMLSEWQ